MERIPLEDLQLEPAWDPHAVRCEKFGQAGSMPVNRFFPFAAVEDAEHHVFWGAQIAHPASWQMELYRKDEGLALSGGLAGTGGRRFCRERILKRRMPLCLRHIRTLWMFLRSG